MKTKTYREILLYIFWGIITTITNVVIYSLCRINNFFSIQIATAIAWFISVLVAFVSNKFLVFNSRDKEAAAFIRELCLFYVSRILSGLLDIALMTIAAHFGIFSEKVSKLLVNIVIIVINYIFSKVMIFRIKNETR
jgi:putative flippase GtrA